MMPSWLSLAATSWSTGKLHQLLLSNCLLKVLACKLLHRQGLNHRQLIFRSNQHTTNQPTAPMGVDAYLTKPAPIYVSLQNSMMCSHGKA